MRPWPLYIHGISSIKSEDRIDLRAPPSMVWGGDSQEMISY